MTLATLLIVIAVFGLFVIAIVRLTPGYIEYLNVAKALDALKSHADASTPGAITRALEKNFDISNVHTLAADAVEVTREDNVYVVHASYDYVVPFIANLSFQAHFDKSVEIPAQ